jgi:simple sugar transport system ATP-binding protein
MYLGTKETSVPVIAAEGLTKRFLQVVACDEINFEARKGEIHCLLGENGAGKTTFAECLYGFYRPECGSILVRGEHASITSPIDAIRLGIGMVHQHFVLATPLTVIENIVVGTESPGVLLDYSRAEAKVKSLCVAFGIELDLHAKIWQLSVGEQQWVEILKALFVGIEVLILDEPTAVLTPQEADKLFAILQKMKEGGLSVVLITHKLSEVMRVSDRVTVLRKGRRVATHYTTEMSEEKLAELMVGREVLFRQKRQAISPGPAILEVRDLRAQGDRGNEALQGISFTLRQNEILGIAGVAGNGQKELFEVLVGVRKPKAGKILLAGEDITGSSPSAIIDKGICHIPEDRISQGLIPEFSIAENLILGYQRKSPFKKGVFLDSKRIGQFATNCVSSFEIVTPSTENKTEHLSGGNLQKVILARELSQCHTVLLANQPTRGLDVGVIEYVHKLLLEKRGQGTGILLASEDLDEILSLSDRIAVMYRGRIVDILDAKEASIKRIGFLMAGLGGASC